MSAWLEPPAFSLVASYTIKTTAVRNVSHRDSGYREGGGGEYNQRKGEGDAQPLRKTEKMKQQ